MIVSHTTGSREAAERLGARAAEAGIEFVDAPVSGTAANIVRGELTVLVGGSDVALERCRALLEAHSSTILPTGVVGTATALKRVNNALFAANSQLAAAALTLAADQGIEMPAAMAAFASCSGASAALGYIAGVGGPNVFAERALPYLRKDVGVVRDYARERGLDLGVIETTIIDGPLELI